MSDDISSGVRAWAIQAAADLESAVVMFQNGIWYNACLNSQQTAEKFSKAVLLHAGLALDFTHNIERVAQAIESAGLRKFSEDELDGARELSRTFVTGRYPSISLDAAPCEMFSRTDAIKHLKHALTYSRICRELAPDLFTDGVLAKIDLAEQEISRQSQPQPSKG